MLLAASVKHGLTSWHILVPSAAPNRGLSDEEKWVMTTSVVYWLGRVLSLNQGAGGNTCTTQQ